MALIYLSGGASNETNLRIYLERYGGPMAKIYLSGHTNHARKDAETVAQQRGWYDDPMPLLLSYAYLYGVEMACEVLKPNRLMLDSGAYSASTLGITIDIDGLIEEARNPRWTEVVTLDVIGDWRASSKNAARMADELGEARTLPVFHVGEPWELLSDYCARWPKVGIGGLVPVHQKHRMKFLDQCMARIWPKLVHVFGMSGEEILTSYPVDTVDAASWILAPALQKQAVIAGQKIVVPNLDRANGIAGWIAEMRRRQRVSEDRWGRILAPLRAAHRSVTAGV